MLFLPRGRRDDSPRSEALAALELQMSVFVVSRGVGGGRWEGEVAQGQLKHRCLPVGGIPSSPDFHLEASPESGAPRPRRKSTPPPT